ncbi:MAG: hypothetical protein E7049_11520 [Lentisphaerae bacterium]|nr:hypothetical protein [Lentisphaerota bacterium]
MRSTSLLRIFSFCASARQPGVRSSAANAASGFGFTSNVVSLPAVSHAEAVRPVLVSFAPFAFFAD